MHDCIKIVNVNPRVKCIKSSIGSQNWTWNFMVVHRKYNVTDKLKNPLLVAYVTFLIKTSVLEAKIRTKQNSFSFDVSFVFERLWQYHFSWHQRFDYKAFYQTQRRVLSLFSRFKLSYCQLDCWSLQVWNI